MPSYLQCQNKLDPQGSFCCWWPHDCSPIVKTYASIFSQERVRISFLLAALNDCEIIAGNIRNAYPYARTIEKILYRAGLECGPTVKGQVCVIVRALYGIMTSANAWRTRMYDTLQNRMGFQYSYADSDFWMKASTKSDGITYYTYILVYVDAIIIISHETKR